MNMLLFFFLKSRVMCKMIVLRDRDSLNDRVIHVSKPLAS